MTSAQRATSETGRAWKNMSLVSQIIFRTRRHLAFDKKKQFQ